MTLFNPMRLAVPAAATVMLACMGCAVFSGPLRLLGLGKDHLALGVKIATDANDGVPLKVDVVMVDDKKLLPQISKLTAKQWFATRQDLGLMNPGKLHVVPSEWVAGERVPDLHLAASASEAGVLLFVDYSSPGEHRAVLPKEGRVTLDLGPDEFILTPPGKTPASLPY